MRCCSTRVACSHGALEREKKGFTEILESEWGKALEALHDPLARRSTEAHLIQAVEMVLHTFDRHVFPVLNALGFEHLREGPFTFLRYQAIL
jgi:hypothetical protein